MSLKDLLLNLNPAAKIVIMVIVVTIASFSYDIYFTPILIVLTLACGKIFAGIEFTFVFKKMRMLILSAFFISCFFLLSRGLHFDGTAPAFSAGESDLRVSLAIGLRMFLFALLSFIFTETTDSVMFIQSMIHQWRIPYKYCYAFLAAYRFVPTFADELQRIKNAHEARGVISGNGVLINIINTPKYIIPLLINAVRKGEQVSIAMEARCFCVYDDRTYFTKTVWKKRDTYAIIITALTVSAVLIILIYFDLFSFAKSFGIND